MAGTKYAVSRKKIQKLPPIEILTNPNLRCVGLIGEVERSFAA